MMKNEFLDYQGKSVLVTGHTGFKGSWMVKWLLNLNAKVIGYSLDPPTSPSLFGQLKLEENIEHLYADVRDLEKLKEVIKRVKPDIIFHLAAQSLVNYSYKNPIETIETNILGTANVLEAVRQTQVHTNVVIITSDKCYENREWFHGYRENDPMGGYDPYSMSKGASELVLSSWRRSFFNTNNYQSHGVKVASARAGNVIGGGDWAENRIVPDCFRSLMEKAQILVRNPLATRPWQHVLEPIGGYLLLGLRLLNASENELEKYGSGFNFGPAISSNRSVRDLVEKIIFYWGDGSWYTEEKESNHEAGLLNLNVDKAYHVLDWQPVWGFEATIEETCKWYKNMSMGKEDVDLFTQSQLVNYQDKLVKILNEK